MYDPCKIHIRRGVTSGWVLLAGAGFWLAATTGCLPQNQPLDPFPDGILEKLVLQKGECPPAYDLITNTNLFAQAGLTRNPDYILKRDDLERIIQMDGVAAFLALYGTGDSVRLMLKGVYFRELQHALKYAEVQNSRQRLVMASRCDTPGGFWLLFFACDPDLSYDEAEIERITRGLEHYQRRLKLTPVFDQMSGAPSDE